MRIFDTLLVVTVASVLCAGCHEALPPEVPASLVGVWKTSSPRYAGRYFEISNTAFVIGAGGEDVEAYALRGVVSEVVDDRVRYTLHYNETDGAESIFAFYFDGNIRLVNQEGILWTKTESNNETPTTH